MKPILFAENSTQFNTNGIGRMADAIYCKVVEERNGMYELEMQYPVGGQHYNDIAIRNIIVAKPSAGSGLQAFRIYKITKPINGKVTIYAQHVSYDLTKNVVMPFSVMASSTAANATLQGLKTNAVETCPFDFETDVNTVASYMQEAPASIRQRLGGVEGSVLDQFSGEYEWDNFIVKLHKNRGIEKDVTLRYGKNITDFEQEENIANTVTGIVPFWINTDKTESVMLTEKVVYAPNADLYSSKLTVPLDMSGEWEEKPTEEQLRNRALVYVNKAGFGLPKVSIKLSFINLADTEEYKDILPLQEVSLCDTIKVQFERLGINTTAKIVKTNYDVLNERYNSIEVGSIKESFATVINDMNTAMAAEVEAVNIRNYSDTAEFVDNATAWLTSSGGYVVANRNPDGSWKELLFLDNRDIDLARNVLRINENGIGFSSTGVAGPYTQAWTLDGRLVIGGTNAPSFTCYDSSGNEIFQASRQGVSAMHVRDVDKNCTINLTRVGATVMGAVAENGLTWGFEGEDFLRAVVDYDAGDRKNETARSGYMSIESEGTIFLHAHQYQTQGRYSGQDNYGITIRADGMIDIDANDNYATPYGDPAIDLHTHGGRLRINGNWGYNGSVLTGLSYTEIRYISEIWESGGYINWTTTWREVATDSNSIGVHEGIVSS